MKGERVVFNVFSFAFFLLKYLPIAQPNQQANNIIGSAITTHIIPSIAVNIKIAEKTPRLKRVPKTACFKSGNKPELIPIANGRKKNNPNPKSAMPANKKVIAILQNIRPTKKLVLNDLFLKLIIY